MAIAIAPHDAGQPNDKLDLPPAWWAATKVVLMVAFLTAVVLAIPLAAVYLLSTALG